MGSAVRAVTKPVRKIGSSIGGAIGGKTGAKLGGIIGGGILMGPAGMMPGVKDALSRGAPAHTAFGIKAPKYNTGLVGRSDRLEKNLRLDQYNQADLKRARNVASGKFTSPWLAAQRKDIDAQVQDNLADIGATAQTGQEMAEQGLAAGAGLGRGASQRLGRRSKFQELMSRQQARRAGNVAKDQADLVARQTRMQGIQALPGVEQAALSMQQQNAQNMLRQKRLADALDRQRYQSEMKMHGTEQSANALAQAGSKGLIPDALGGLGF